MSNAVVTTSFWSAFILDIFIVGYAFYLFKQIKGGLLSKVTIYAALSAFVFGIHHILEIFLEHVHHGIAIAEGIELLAATLLAMAVFQMYKLTGGYYAK